MMKDVDLEQALADLAAFQRALDAVGRAKVTPEALLLAQLALYGPERFERVCRYLEMGALSDHDPLQSAPGYQRRYTLEWDGNFFRIRRVRWHDHVSTIGTVREPGRRDPPHPPPVQADQPENHNAWGVLTMLALHRGVLTAVGVDAHHHPIYTAPGETPLAAPVGLG